MVVVDGDDRGGGVVHSVEEVLRVVERSSAEPPRARHRLVTRDLDRRIDEAEADVLAEERPELLWVRDRPAVQSGRIFEAHAGLARRGGAERGHRGLRDALGRGSPQRPRSRDGRAPDRLHRGRAVLIFGGRMFSICGMDAIDVNIASSSRAVGGARLRHVRPDVAVVVHGRRSTRRNLSTTSSLPTRGVEVCARHEGMRQEDRRATFACRGSAPAVDFVRRAGT